MNLIERLGLVLQYLKLARASTHLQVAVELAIERLTELERTNNETDSD